MLWRTSELIGYGIRATDGDIGHVEEFLVEDGSWYGRPFSWG